MPARCLLTISSSISLLIMAATSIPHPWKYDVFVSFRGEDIRKNFMDHMFNNFKHKGIHAFRDDRELPKGEYISRHLYKAIMESRFLIVIFSKNYASSTWCLRELVKILQYTQMEKPIHEVQIIFYDVKPEVVRKQTGSYAEAFAKHDVSNRREVDKWREALSMAANLSGWDLQDKTNGYEYKFIDCISKDILKKLCDGPLHVGENLVGIDFHFDKLNLSRFVGSHKVNMLGICGISGIGKTTLAKAIYNLMHIHFEGSCFCEDVRKQQDLTQVQMQLIDNITKTRAFKISSVGHGIMVIKKMISSKPILLVLDDIDDHEQLEVLAGSASWFCQGSLIIFTGKDKQLLRSHRVDEDDIHDMDFLDEDRSFELFCSYAFKENDSSIGFEEVSQKVVNYVQGHPLALKHLGLFLYGKTVDQWVSELDKLKVHPNEKIQRVLRLSYDGLDLHQKNILLDIACLFIGENKDFVASVLDGCNFFAVTNMQVLFDKSLITISSYNSLQMHDLIQAMAREIVREESIMPGKHRRLWNSSQVYNVLSEKKVPITEEVEVLVLSLEKFSQKVHIDANDFAHMKKLRILKIYQEEKLYEQKLELEDHNVIFSGNLYYLSNELSLFYWHGYPFKNLPSDFYPENIVAIDLSYSNIKRFWTTPKCFRRLKVMKLRYCCKLKTTPDFSEITNLKELSLEGCVNLVSVHPSIGMLKRLVVLNLRDCKRLGIFPSKIEMDCLQVLNLSGCLKVDQLPEAVGRIKTLTELHIYRTAITELPSFVSSLINLESMSFGSQGGIQPRWWNSSKQQHPQRSVSLEGLHMLKYLNLSNCRLEQVPESIGDLLCLKELYLNRNDFTSLPGSLCQLSHLEILNLYDCKKLEVLPELPPRVWNINASDCTSLEEVSGSAVIRKFNNFSNCPDSSITSQGFSDQLSAFLFHMGFHTKRWEFFTQDKGYDYLDIGYHGNSVPKWFTNRSTDNHVKVELPSDWCRDEFIGYGTCVVFKFKDPYKLKGYSLKNFDGVFLNPEDYFPVSIRDYFRNKLTGIQDSYMIWLHYTRDIWEWREAKNFVTFCFEENNEAVEVKECGARLICHEDKVKYFTNQSMLKDLPAPAQHGGVMSIYGSLKYSSWSW